MRRVALLIPDSAPLISLAIGNALEFLLRLDIPIRLVDVVYEESASDLTEPGAAAIRKFVEDNPQTVNVVQTEVGELLTERRLRQPDYRARNIGEAAIAQFLADLDRYLPGTDPVLVLFDDVDAQKRQIYLHGRAHLLTTISMLKGMETVGLIPSAEAIIDAIRKAGRSLSPHGLDIPAPDSGEETSWLPKS